MPLFDAHPFDRVQVFIDGQNVFGTVKSLGKKIDYRQFMEEMRKQTRLIHANYFTTVRENADDQFFGVLDFLEFNGYNIVTKNIRDHVDDKGFIRVRGTMIGEMTAAMVMAAERTDHIILMTGDGELQAAVEACKLKDTRVTVVSHDNVISEELRRSCDHFYRITDLPSHILRDKDEEFS